MKRDFSKTLKMRIQNTPWSESHGFSDESPGATIFYVSVAQVVQAKKILVIGSGAGFVPKLFLENCPDLLQLVLVDAFLPETGNGSPLDVKFKTATDYPLIKINRHKLLLYKTLSAPFFKFVVKNQYQFNLIFIDGDHSEYGFESDLTHSLQSLSPGGPYCFMTPSSTTSPKSLIDF
jgi:predicted O-methyltransferase YrrM